MTVAEKIRQCTDEQLSRLLTELHEALIAVECETNHDINPKKLLKLLQKPFVPDVMHKWLDDLENEKP